MYAEYLSSNSFRVLGDETSEFIKDRRVKLNCGVDGIIIASVVSSVYDLTNTTVVIDESGVTANLIGVLYSVVKPGQEGNIANHTHTASEGDGGELDISMTFAGLSDTPSTYSGTEGYYLQSTGSGTVWATISGGGGTSDVVSFLDLDDTPTTYSGLDGLYAQVSGTQVIFADLISDVFAGYVAPDENIGKAHSLYVDRELKEVYYRESVILDRVDSVEVKSVVIDITDNQGDPYFVGIRSVEFKLQGSIISLGSSDFTSYSSSIAGTAYLSEYAFDTSKSKTGSQVSNAWLSGSGSEENARLVCVFNELQRFDEIVINNHHDNGSSVERGAKNVKIYISSDTITSTMYGEVIPSSDLIFDGQLDPHVVLNVIDDQSLVLVLPLANSVWEKVTTYNDTSNFIDLEDTPSTYSGTDGQYLVSNGSSLVWEGLSGFLYSSPTNVPTGLTVSNVGDFYLVSDLATLYKRNRMFVPGGYETKSVVIDIADNWGIISYTSIRMVEFLDENLNVIENTTDYTAYASSNFYGTQVSIERPYYSDQPKTGQQVNSWFAYVDTNIRTICVFDEPKIIYGIIINNASTDYHTGIGAKNTKIYLSQDAITDTTYGATVTNSIKCFDGQLAIHIDEDIADDQQLILENMGSDSGWDEVLKTPKKLTDLEDAPSTYSGTEGYYLQSTGSGTEWSLVTASVGMSGLTDYIFGSNTVSGTGDVYCNDLYTSANSVYIGDTKLSISGTKLLIDGESVGGISLYSSENAPTGLEENRNIGDFDIATSEGVFYIKNRWPSKGNIVAKSVVFDMVDNYGGNTIAVRSIDFMFQGELISNLSTTNFVAYATSVYDEINYAPANAFDTSLSKIGHTAGTEWYADGGTNTNQRLICVFNTEQVFDSIIINNSHRYTSYTNYGIKNFKITVSSDNITDVTYDNPISNSYIIFNGSINEHSLVDEEDPQELDVQGPLTDTGWDTILTVPKNLLDLNDTPSTYSGTEGHYLRSTGSGITINQVDEWVTETQVPDVYTYAYPNGTYYLSTATSTVFQKERPVSYNFTSFLAEGVKSVVLDFADNWGRSSMMDVRAVDFYDDANNKIIITESDGSFYASSTYDASRNLPKHAFITSLSKTSSSDYTSWMSSVGVGVGNVNQRLIIVFNELQTISRIDITNDHYAGTNTDRGVKNTKIYTTTDTVTDVVYGNTVPNATLVFDGQIDEHNNVDEADTQTLELLNNVGTFDTGWDVVLTVPKNFTYLEDTPSTYSGTEGHCLQSTGSGIVFSPRPPVVYTSEDAPTGFEDATVGDFNIVNSDDTIYVRNRIATIEDVTAKSVILDIADNWGDPSFISIRSVDFFYGGELITNITSTNFVAYATTFHSSTYAPQYSFDTSKSKIGTLSGNQWLSLSSNITNQRLICVFNEATTFDEIVINNAHSYGDQVSRGSKNIKISFSTDEITDTTYNATISNSLVLFDGQLNQHITSDVEDPQTLDVYGEVTDSGWDELLKVSKSLLDLSDTPSTYSGAGGYYLISTSSGVIWELPTGRIVDNVTPDYFTEGNVGDFIINGTDRSIHEKNREGSIEGTTARSVIFDIADVWGGASTGIRSIWFYNDDELVVTSDTNADAYATNSNGSGYAAILAFDTSLPKIGAAYDNSWQSIYSSDQRLIIVFNNTITFDQIIVNNYHDSGTWTNKGAKNVKIYATPSVYTDTTFEAVVTSGTLLFDDQFTQHPATNIVADELITLPDFTIDTGWDEIISFPNNLIGLIDGETDPTIKTYDIDTYYISKESSTIFKLNDSPTASGTIGNVKSVIFDIADNYGNGYNIGIRAVEFAKDGVVWPLTTTDCVAYATTYYDIEWAYPINVFDTTLLKTGVYNDVDSAGWLSNTYQTTNQRLIVVFNNSLDFDEIIINNAHSSGSNTNWGAENVVVTVSTSEITDTTYAAAIENASVVFDGQFAEHVASDVVDDQSITLTAPTTEEFIYRTWDSVFEAPTSFIALEDTPTTYSGGGQYLRTTSSGIDAIDGIILKAPNESEWLIKVTNSGTLYTVEV